MSNFEKYQQIQRVFDKLGKCQDRSLGSATALVGRAGAYNARSSAWPQVRANAALYSSGLDVYNYG